MFDSEFEPGAHPGTIMAKLAEPTAAKPVTLAVIADPHVATQAEGTSKLFDQTEAHLRNAIADIRARGADAVLSVGDLTKDGEPWNYDAVNEMLSELDVPFYAVPGNHDVPKADDEHETPPVSEFANWYTPSGSFPFSTSVGGVDVVGLNTAGTAEFLYETHDGALDPAREKAIMTMFDETESPIVLSHHNLPAMTEQFRIHRDTVEPEMGVPPVTRDGDMFGETLSAGDPSILLTGHLHMPSTATMSGLREIMAPTTCSFPQSYLSLTIGRAGTVVRLHPVASQDEIRRAYKIRSTDTTGSRGQTAMAAERLAMFPLIDETLTDPE